MPLQQILPTWLAWNNANFPTQSGLEDLRTQQDFPAGGLNLGDYFDATEKEANACSFLPVGLLHWGRYRLVQVDSGATAANVQTGTVGCARQGTFVQGCVVANPGSGGTPGTYNLAIPPGNGGGSGAVIQVVVGSAGAIVFAGVLQGGFNYILPPAVPLTSIPGLTSAIVAAQLNFTANVVTSLDVGYARAVAAGSGNGPPPRPVIFLNPIAPGNFGFVQELGLATVRGFTNLAAVGVGISSMMYGQLATGTMTTAASATSLAVGLNVDVAYPSALFKVVISNYMASACQD